MLVSLPVLAGQAASAGSIKGVAGQSITHRWKSRSRVMATAEFDVKNDPEKGLIKPQNEAGVDRRMGS